VIKANTKKNDFKEVRKKTDYSFSMLMKQEFKIPLSVLFSVWLQE
jgi:hypothetical protein